MTKITHQNMTTATPAAIRKLDQRLTSNVGGTAYGRWLVGEWLMARHAETKHGEWEPWVKKHFQRSTSIARRYIRQAKSFRVHLIKAAKVEKYEDVQLTDKLVYDATELVQQAYLDAAEKKPKKPKKKVKRPEPTLSERLVASAGVEQLSRSEARRQVQQVAQAMASDCNGIAKNPDDLRGQVDELVERVAQLAALAEQLGDDDDGGGDGGKPVMVVDADVIEAEVVEVAQVNEPKRLAVEAPKVQAEDKKDAESGEPKPKTTKRKWARQRTRKPARKQTPKPSETLEERAEKSAASFDQPFRASDLGKALGVSGQKASRLLQQLGYERRGKLWHPPLTQRKTKGTKVVAPDQRGS